MQIQNIWDRILYSQALRIKQTCATLNIAAKSLSDFVRRVITQSYWPSVLKQLRKELKKNYKKDTPINTCIELAITYHQFLPNISKIIRKLGTYY